MRHKRIELSLLSELDPKSSASTNSANAASRSVISRNEQNRNRVQRYNKKFECATFLQKKTHMLAYKCLFALQKGCYSQNFANVASGGDANK